MDENTIIDEDKAIIDCVRDYILTCPHLKEGLLNIEWLGNEPTQYVIEEVPLKTIINKYLDGSSYRQFGFLFASREFLGQEDVDQNIRNSLFYEKFCKWFEDNTANGILPDLGPGRNADNILAISSGYLFSVDSGYQNGRYQIQCRLEYTQLN